MMPLDPSSLVLPTSCLPGGVHLCFTTSSLELHSASAHKGSEATQVNVFCSNEQERNSVFLGICHSDGQSPTLPFTQLYEGMAHFICN